MIRDFAGRAAAPCATAPVSDARIPGLSTVGGKTASNPLWVSGVRRANPPSSPN